MVRFSRHLAVSTSAGTPACRLLPWRPSSELGALKFFVHSPSALPILVRSWPPTAPTRLLIPLILLLSIAHLAMPTRRSHVSGPARPNSGRFRFTLLFLKITSDPWTLPLYRDARLTFTLTSQIDATWPDHRPPLSKRRVTSINRRNSVCRPVLAS